MWYKKDISGNITEICSVPVSDDFIYSEEDIVNDYRGKLIFKSKTETDEYKKAEAEYNASKVAEKLMPTVESSIIAFVKKYFGLNMTALNLTTDEKLEISGICDEWEPGVHKKGEINNVGYTTWEVTQDYDNNIYPDINPNKPQTWANFNKPLHGSAPERARPFWKPTAGTTDMYLAGEYMIWTDGKIYKCVSNTVFSPEEYAQAWEVYE